VPTTGVSTLAQLAAESTLVADAVVEGTQSLDEDRLRVYRLRVTRTLKGSPTTEAAVIEMRGATTRPGLLSDGMRAILLLRPSPRLSYLTEHLPNGEHLALSGGRDGIVPIANDAEAALVEKALTEGKRIAELTDEAEAGTARRALAFTELDSGQARLAADALVHLRRLDDMTAPTADELRVLERTLASRTVPAATRTGLVRLIGERKWKQALPALRAAVIDPPELLDAILTARAHLGAPADKDELKPYLSSKDPAVRAAAVRALAELPEPAIGELGRFATSDAEVDVRVAAIEALGSSQKPGAVPTLSQTFAEPRREVRQASGRALLAIGGQPASDALVNLALHGGDPDTRKYAAVLLLVSSGKDSAAVQKLMASNPSGEVRQVVEHGLKWQHSHAHDD
jgi:HEAT repeat protein